MSGPHEGGGEGIPEVVGAGGGITEGGKGKGGGSHSDGFRVRIRLGI